MWAQPVQCVGTITKSPFQVRFCQCLFFLILLLVVCKIHLPVRWTLDIFHFDFDFVQHFYYDISFAYIYLSKLCMRFSYDHSFFFLLV